MKNRERWLELAELAANEQDPDKLMLIVREIDQLLQEKENRLRRPGTPSAPPAEK